jgi:cytidylate kinase
VTPYALAISGRIASGKSTLAVRLAEKMNCARASFGEYVRIVAESKGLEPTRDNLQAVGADLVESGWEPFCRAVLSRSSWQPGQLLVVDGIRHVEAVRQLKSLVAPTSVILVHVRIDEQVREDRLREKQGTSEAHEAHSTEHDVKSALPLIADLVVDGARPVEQLADEIIEFAGRPNV